MACGASTTEDAFGQMLADLFGRLGFEVDPVPSPDGRDSGLIVRFPSRIRHAIAVQGVHVSYPVDAPSIHRALTLMQRFGAGEGWVVTDAVFAPDARQFAMDQGVRLIEGPGLSGLLTQAATEKGREAAVDALLAHSGFYDGEPPAADSVGYQGVQPDAAVVQQTPTLQGALQEPRIQPTVQMPRQQDQDTYGYGASAQETWRGPCDYDYDYDAAPPMQAEPDRRERREASRRRPSGCRAGCVTVLVILLVLALFLLGMLLALPTVLDQLPLGEALSVIKAHALTFFEQLKDAVANRLGRMAG